MEELEKLVKEAKVKKSWLGKMVDYGKKLLYGSMLLSALSFNGCNDYLGIEDDDDNEVDMVEAKELSAWPQGGNLVEFDISVRNVGDKPFTTDYYVDFEDDGTFDYTETITLNPSEIFFKTLSNLYAGPGPEKAYLTVDPTPKETEIGNNSRSCEFNVN